MAVCSNKPVAFTRKLVDTLGLSAYFGAVLGPEDVSRPKPDPEMLLRAAGRLELPPAACLYLGDMTIDVETGRAAGMTVWAVPSGSHDAATLRAAKPDRILRDMGELPGILLASGGP